MLDGYVAGKESAATEIEAAPAADDPIDISQLLDRIEDDRALLGELVELFRDDYPMHLQAAQKAIDEHNPDELERAGHTLKGALGNLSAKQASALALDLEMMGKANELGNSQSTLDRLQHEIGHAVSALEALCSVESR